MVRRMSCGVWLGAAMMCCLAGTAAVDKLAEMQARFDHEKNPVHRAKLLEKLGDAEFDEARRAFKANDLSTVGTVLEKYRDNVRVALEGLKKKRTDAQKDSNGYRQLEIHVRRGIREADEIILRVPEVYQPPLQIVRRDLDSMDRELIRMLFHHHDEEPGAPQRSEATTSPEHPTTPAKPTGPPEDPR
jgi:succinate dehydrogenase flavin-adding protein (antitoxin of CptAB toxin-antitoxin module)